MNKDILSLLISESENYLNIDKITSIIQSEDDFKHIPVQPLYLAFQSVPQVKKLELLPKLSKEQRQIFLDIDLWDKDKLDMDGFNSWVALYANSSEELQTEFVKGDEFPLYFKGRFNIWTFDVDDPLYPEHDNYFLTDDSLLLIEYDETFPYVQELKSLIKNLYTQEGVEKAYAFLFKIVSDQMGLMQEDEYRWKKNRLEDKGFVDYFDALEKVNSFPTQKHIINFIRLAKNLTGNLEEDSSYQVPHYNFVAPLNKATENLLSELNKIENGKRFDFLKFNLVKLINANIELNGGLSEGTIGLTKSSEKLKSFVNLGFQYTFKEWETLDRQGNFFDFFTITDLYRVGKSLIEIKQEQINKAYARNEIDETFDSFLGNWAENFISQAFTTFEIEDIGRNKFNLETLEGLEKFNELSDLIVGILPFAKAFYDRFHDLKSQGTLNDHFYLNYNLDDVDFSALLLSNLSNFYLKNGNDLSAKLGLTIEQYKKVAALALDPSSVELKRIIKSFSEEFSLNQVPGIQEYILEMAIDAFSGFNLDELKEEDFKHVGGPIIFNLN